MGVNEKYKVLFLYPPIGWYMQLIPINIKGVFVKMFEKKENKIVKSKEFFRIGVNCDNSNDLKGAINNYSKAIKLNKHPMAFYHRACVYKDMGKYKEAIEDFKGYLKYGSSSSQEMSASKVTIEELERKTIKWQAIILLPGPEFV